jgi:hypothetical protein
MSGVYWGLTAMALLDRLDDMDAPRIESFVLACQHPSGGFGGNVGHDPHLLYTLSAVRSPLARGTLRVFGVQGGELGVSSAWEGHIHGSRVDDPDVTSATH